MADIKFGKDGINEEQNLNGCLFYMDLVKKIGKGKIKMNENCLSDWLKTLSDIELQFLIETTMFLSDFGCCPICIDCEDDDCDNCDKCDEYDREMDEMDEDEMDEMVVLKMVDIAHTTGLIYIMETGEENVEFDEEEVGRYLNVLIYCSCVELFRRQGKAKYKKMKLTDEFIDADLMGMQLESLNDGLRKFFEEHEDKK